jgi:hypothetical protein
MVYWIVLILNSTLALSPKNPYYYISTKEFGNIPENNKNELEPRPMGYFHLANQKSRAF